jgi:succinate dehydrogenase / fumarate reductase cytochrome b subunit
VSAHRTVRFYESSIGKKTVMAVSGVILFGFVLGHLVGNLQIYEGPEKLNAYARFLRNIPAALWTARVTLLIMVALHIWSSIQLAVRKKRARPTAYARKKSIGSTYASRTMYWSGPIIAVFVIYHLLHFTFGTVHPHFREGDVYANVVSGFQVIPVSAFYMFAMLLLGMHLYHGLWSMFQTLGVSHPMYTPLLRRLAAVVSALIVTGNISIPIAVMTGLVR